MIDFKRVFPRLARNDDGATAIEYGLLAALIAVVIIAALSGIGEQLQGTFQKVEAELKSANDSSSGGGTGGGATTPDTGDGG
ncbi:Flp family type IVb pilin [Rhodobacteraceae bacterium DSL-40]|uniref:Flp family type IVb pilin n=1 Tax=Amaricoccus sp. B4 TaxID=3368557 RepID=UPI000DAF0AAB